MMAAVLYGKEHLQVEPVAVPKIESGDILVRVKVALTCGTDVKVFRRGYHARMIVPPAVFGHELAGDVVAVGEGVTRFRSGQRVVAANSAPCERLLLLPARPGESLRRSAVQQRRVRRIHPHSGAHRGAQHLRDSNRRELSGCGAGGTAGLRAARLRRDRDPRRRHVAIIGLGPIGLMFVRLAKFTACRVIAIGRRKTQLDRAAAPGADELISTEQVPRPADAVRSLTTGRGVDIAIEAVGKPQTWHWAVDMVRRGGTVNFFGGCPNESKVSLDTSLLHYSEITCKASFHHTPAYIRKALDIICNGDIRASDFVNREEPLANLLEVMRHLMSHNGHLKTAIFP